PQLAYEAGLNYIYDLNNNFFFSIGLHGVIGKWMFFADIPSKDLSAYNLDGNSIIWDKEIWGAIKIPVSLEKKIIDKEKGSLSFRAGLSVNYSGFVPDLRMNGGGIIDSNNHVIQIFSASFSENNHYKPWINFLAALSQSFLLKNQNIFSIN